MVTLVARPIPWDPDNEVAESVGGHLKSDETKRGLLEKWVSRWTAGRVRSDWSPKLGCRWLICHVLLRSLGRCLCQVIRGVGDPYPLRYI
jgi:hypothetical protein